MLASFPASMLNQNLSDLGILKRFNLASSALGVDKRPTKISLPGTVRYQRSMIHFPPTTICQTAAVATVSTMTAASKAIESRTPSSSR